MLESRVAEVHYLRQKPFKTRIPKYFAQLGFQLTEKLILGVFKSILSRFEHVNLH